VTDKWPDTCYGIELDFMRELQVREGFAKYGASVYFSKDRKVTRIVRDGKEYLPSESREWEYIKMTFRGSLLTYVTAVDHLLGVHGASSNFMTTFSREQLPPDHPIRRLLKPFTFRSVYINYIAGTNLFSPSGFLHRTLALTLEGMAQTFNLAWGNFSYEAFPRRVERMGVDGIPFNQDGLDLWHIYQGFVSKYVDQYYTSEEEVTKDVHLIAFWTEVARHQPPSAKQVPLSLDSLKTYLTYSIFAVSAMHNHFGTLAEYFVDPSFCPLAWVEGELSSPPLYAVRAGLLLCAAGFPQPRLLDDFSHIMLDDYARTLCHDFQASLRKQIKIVDKRNITRPQPFQSFNPGFLELSVSI